ncbi:hypothetical protein C3B47_11870 [Flavobacterium columnare]|uniref:hypothetical protein n=1 Tax=Flavobacterium columnare TaxID=996 RepID=UPI000D1A96DE|nr:hypothetical protein [Flavobacterium columnare]MBF6653573.1 hypothetical protein [Flavobacterium columnare]MBF6654615.1 hypothetical protein [Flavobacterium columnare]MBF6657186.1 hypothetical protein [Flavobacterium columnare]PTD16463.1 hypothetical protein C6N29_02295 [Flavobacterium columnare]
MDRIRKYNLISQRFITGCDDIPFIETNCKNNLKYCVLVDVFDTDFTENYFNDFNSDNLYAIYIVGDQDDFGNAGLNVISKYNYYNFNIIVVKVGINFFESIGYINRSDLSLPFFFESDNLEKSKIEEILSSSFYEKQITIGGFRKSFIKIDPLKLLENYEIEKVIDFYINRTEFYLEDVLKLRQNILNIDSDYISKLEISLC